MTDTISLTGLVATVPEHRRIRDDVDVTSFRLASNQRYFDRHTQAWVPGDTNWYTVSSFRHLANNVHSSVSKGDRVIVVGRLRLRKWESGDKNGTAIEVDADSVGHDLAWGTARYTRTPAKDTVPAAVQRSGGNGLDDEYSPSSGAATEEDLDERRGEGDMPQSTWSVTEPGEASEHGRIVAVSGDGEFVPSPADTPI